MAFDFIIFRNNNLAIFRYFISQHNVSPSDIFMFFFVRLSYSSMLNNQQLTLFLDALCGHFPLILAAC